MQIKNINYLAEDFTVKQGSLTVGDGKITSIAAADGAIGNRLLIPGLRNMHSHVPMTLLRGYGEGLPLDRWLNERVFPFEAKLTDDDVYWGSLVGIAEMLASGVTEFADMYDHCGAIVDAVKLAGIRGRISRAFLDFSGESLKGSMREAEELELIAVKHPLITAEAAIHAEYTSNEKYVREAAEFAKEHKLAVQVHLSETAKEHAECKERHGGRTPARYFADCGFFDVPAFAAHCVHCSEDDLHILKDFGVTAVHNPTSNLKLKSGRFDTRKAYDLGVKLALGTDGAASNNNLNLFEEMHLAALLGGFTPEEVLGFALNGKIAVGERADLVLVDYDKAHLQPNHNYLANLVFSAQASDILWTMTDGKIVSENGKPVNFDIAEALVKSAKAALRIAKEI
ncbi:MAG: amidohydrolase [Oscillospiraceae bacterium]|jgi:5-methylthioadenosine/S-adenosylhomocysteine deaminase|nr:amidohydrolase [Oscillospiraceae bacterium]